MEPFVVRFPARTDAESMEQVAAQMALAQSKKPKNAEIDLQGVDFFEPYGIAFLALACRQMEKLGIKPTVILPQVATQQAFYLKRMLVPQNLRRWAELRNFLWPRGRGWKPSSQVLLELTPFRKAVEVERIVVDRVHQILRTQLHFRASELSAFSNTVAELCENVQDHSRETESGFVAAQTYRSHYGVTSGKRCVLLAVVDLGIGIRASLGERFDVSGWTDSIALENAVLRNYSRSANRGLGFETVKKVCKDHHGHFEVRSGQARLVIRQKRVLVLPGVPFPGTQVAIKLWE